MADLSAKTLYNKTTNYTVEDFQTDFQEMLDIYNNMAKIKIDEIREEVNGWDFLIDKDSLIEFDEVASKYAIFIDYQNRINAIIDQVNIRNTVIKHIVSSVKQIGSRFFKGTAKEKDAATTTMLLSINMEGALIESLLAFLVSTKDSITFSTNQLARILREKEAIAKINNTNYSVGSAKKLDNGIPVKPRNIPQI